MNRLTDQEQMRLEVLQNHRKNHQRFMSQAEQDELQALIRKKYVYLGSPHDTKSLDEGLFPSIKTAIKRQIKNWNHSKGTRYDYDDTIELFAKFITESKPKKS